MNTWHSFQGCFVAVGHYVISVLAGMAAWYFMRSLAFPPFVVWTVALNVGMVTFQIVYIVISKIGDKP
jgi:hypothetical protein